MLENVGSPATDQNSTYSIRSTKNSDHSLPQPEGPDQNLSQLCNMLDPMSDISKLRGLVGSRALLIPGGRTLLRNGQGFSLILTVTRSYGDLSRSDESTELRFFALNLRPNTATTIDCLVRFEATLGL